MSEVISKEGLQQKLNYTEWSHVIKREWNSWDIFLDYSETSTKKSRKRSKAKITRNQREDQKRHGWGTYKQLDMDFGLTLEAAETIAHDRTV